MVKIRKKNSLSKSQYKHLTLVLVIVIVILSIIAMASFSKAKVAEAYSNSAEKSYKEKNKELISKLYDVDNKLSQLNDKYYEEKLSKLFSKEKLAAMAKDAWSYSLKVNSEEFKEDNITTTARDITIVLTEAKDFTKPLPSNILPYGSITGGDKGDNYFEHMIIQTTAQYEKTTETDKNITYTTYKFKNLSPGTIITLNLSEPLKDRLKLKDSLLEVISK